LCSGARLAFVKSTRGAIMKVALIAALSGALVAVGAQALPSAIGDPAGSSEQLVQPAASRTTATTDDSKARRARHQKRERHHVRGRHHEQEREHARASRANDDSTTTTGTTTAPQSGVDVSGPCDEAEHANDPRCAPGTPQRVEDDNDDGVNHDAGDDHGGDDDGPGHR
jgi:hypothetical protein